MFLSLRTAPKSLGILEHHFRKKIRLDSSLKFLRQGSLGKKNTTRVSLGLQQKWEGGGTYPI